MFTNRISIPILLGALFLAPTVLLLVLKGVTRRIEAAPCWRMWNDNTGRFSARARLQTDNGNSVILHKRGGNIVTVPIGRLSMADRQYLKNGSDESSAGMDFDISKAGQLFPKSFLKWKYSDSKDLWSLLVDVTPLWVTLIIPAGLALFGYLLLMRSQTG